MRGYRISKPVEYPHTAISAFIGALRDHFIKHVYTKFGYSMVGSFDKAIQFIDQMNNPEITREVDFAHLFPFIVYTPTLEEPEKTGDFLWTYHQGAPYMVNWNHDPVRFEDQSTLSLITRRMRGNVDIRIFAESQMETHDIQMAFLNYFHGLNTYTVLNNITQYFVLDDVIRLFKNRREERVLRLEESNLEKILVPSTNQMEYVICISAAPLLMLTSLSDASSYYGGSGLTEYALSGALSFELEVPSNVVLQTDIAIDNIDFSIGLARNDGTVGETPLSTEEEYGEGETEEETETESESGE